MPQLDRVEVSPAALTNALNDPGTSALYTGETARTHGIWYDDTYERSLYSAASNCTGPPGFEVLEDET